MGGKRATRKKREKINEVDDVTARTVDFHRDSLT